MKINKKIYKILIKLLLFFGIFFFIFLLLDNFYLISGKYHVDIWFPGPEKPGVDLLKSRIDAHDKPEGDMTYPITLPNNTIIYCSMDGQTAFNSIFRENQERVKEHGWEPFRFELKEDTFFGRFYDGLIKMTGPRLGRPEIATGNPKAKNKDKNE